MYSVLHKLQNCGDFYSWMICCCWGWCCPGGGGGFICWKFSVYATLGDHNGDVVGVPNPGQSDVKLAVGEDR